MSQEATQDQRQEGGRKRIQLSNMTALGDSDKRKRNLLEMGMPGLVTLLSDLGALSIEGATGSFWFLFWFIPSSFLLPSTPSFAPVNFFFVSLCQCVCMYMFVCKCDVCIHVCAEACGSACVQKPEESAKCPALSLPAVFPGNSLSLNLELVLRPVIQSSCLCPTRHWGSRSTWPCLAFYMGGGV